MTARRTRRLRAGKPAVLYGRVELLHCGLVRFREGLPWVWRVTSKWVGFCM
jgi:hypothetical protein